MYFKASLGSLSYSVRYKWYMLSSLDAIEIHNINVTVKLKYLKGNDEENVRILIKDTVFFIFLTYGWSHPQKRNLQSQGADCTNV